MSSEESSQPSLFSNPNIPRSRTETFAVTTAAQRVLKNDPKRVSLIFSNNTANDIYVSPKNDVSTTLGIKIAKSGGYYELERKDWGQLVTGEWFVISDGSVNLLVQEVLEV